MNPIYSKVRQHHPKSELFFSLLIKSFQVRGHIWKQLAQIIFRGILNQPNLVFSVNVGVIWWGGSECAWLFVFTKGWVQANLRVSSPMRSNEPPSPKKAILRDYEQPFSFNKGGPSWEITLWGGTLKSWAKTLCLDRLLPHLGVRQLRCAPDRQGNKDEGAVNGIKEVKFFCFTLGSICEYNMET